MSPFAPITLDRDAEVPLGVQLTWILRARVTGGELTPGERLPGARELAAQAGVNVNTVRTVFARLEDEGLLTVVHGKGTFVAGGAEGAAARRAGRRAGRPAVGPAADDAAALAAEVISEARRRGVDPRALAAALYVHPAAEPSAAPAGSAFASTSPFPSTGAPLDESASPGAAAPPAPPASGTDDPAARRALRTEIAELERRLATLPALLSAGSGAPTGTTPYPSDAGRLLSVEELTRQRDELAEQVARARAVERRAARDAGTPTARSANAQAAKRAPARTTTVRGARLRWVPGA